MLEFALASTLLFALFTGSFQFGYTFLIYNRLVSAVNDGARFASIAPLSKTAGSNAVPTAFRDAVRNVVIYGKQTPVSGDRPLVAGLGVSNVAVDVTYQTTGNGAGTNYVPRQVSVSISNFSVNAVVKTFQFNNKPQLSLPYFGSYCSNGTSC